MHGFIVMGVPDYHLMVSYVVGRRFPPYCGRGGAVGCLIRVYLVDCLLR